MHGVLRYTKAWFAGGLNTINNSTVIRREFSPSNALNSTLRLSCLLVDVLAVYEDNNEKKNEVKS